MVLHTGVCEFKRHVGVNPLLHFAFPLEQIGSGGFPEELDETQVASTQLSPRIESQH